MPFAFNGGLLIGLGVMLLLSFLGWATRQLKKASDQREEEARRERRKKQRQGEGTADIDRFLQEVDRQRRGDAPPRPAPPVIPTARPVAASKRGRLADTVGPSFPEAKPAAASRANMDDLPVAAVVASPARSPTTVVTKPARLVKPLRASVAVPSPTALPTTAFGQQFVAMLARPQSAAMAVVLHEVFGPPKCKQEKKPG